MRPKFTFARSRWASSAASWARSWRVSSSTRMSPARTALPESKLISRHRAGKVRADHHAVNRLHGPDYSRGRGPFFPLHHHAGDRLWRRLKRSSLHRGLHLLELYEAQGRDQHRRHAQHQEHSLCHDFPFSLKATTYLHRRQLACKSRQLTSWLNPETGVPDANPAPSVESRFIFDSARARRGFELIQSQVQFLTRHCKFVAAESPLALINYWTRINCPSGGKSNGGALKSTRRIENI